MAKNGILKEMTRGSQRIRRLSLIGVAAGAMTTAVDAAAQNQNGDTTASLDRIIVVGRKKEENLQDTPVAITALTPETITATSSADLSDLGKLAPNVDIDGAVATSGGGNAQIFVRGVGQTDFIITTDPGVGVYTDGVYLGRTTGANLSLLDLQSVEILRGPQGTLFGRNTIGGAIVVSTKRSSDEYEAYAQFTKGKYDRTDAQIGASGPIIADSLGARIALGANNRDGYALGPNGEEFGDIEQFVGRVSFDYSPSSTLDARLILDYSKQDQGSVPTEMIAINPAAPVLGLYNSFVGEPAGMPLLPNSLDADPFTAGGTDVNVNDHEIWGVNGTLNWKIGRLNLKSISAYRELDAVYGRDCDGTTLLYCSTRNTIVQEQLSQELQLSGNGLNNRLSWTGGLFFYKEKASDFTEVQIATGLFDALEALPATLPCLDPGAAPPPCVGDPFFLTGVAPGGPGNSVNVALNLELEGFKIIQTDAYAVFGQGYYALTDRLTIEGGIRYSSEEKDLFFVQSREGVPTPFIDNVRTSDKYSAVSGRAGVSYRVSDDVMTYFSATRGFKSGGFNGRASADAAVDSFDPETLWSYEVGVKSELANRRLRLNLAGFYSDYKDIQLQALVVDVETGQALNSIDNAAGARIYGAELEAQALITDRLRFDVGLGYLDTKYTDVGGAVGITLDSTFPRAPEFTANIGAEYSWPVGGWGVATLRGDYFRNSGYYQDVVNTELTREDGYGLLNLRASLTNESESLEFAVFATNVTDELYYANAGSAIDSLGVASINPGRPREWGVSITARF